MIILNINSSKNILCNRKHIHNSFYQMFTPVNIRLRYGVHKEIITTIVNLNESIRTQKDENLLKLNVKLEGLGIV